MRILIIKTAPGEINVKKATYNHQELGLAKALIRLGHDCDVMCCAEGETRKTKIPVDDKFITLYSMKARVVLKNGFYGDIDGILEKYDILHVSEYNQLYTWHLSKKYSSKMVCYHGPYYCAFNKRYNLMAKVFDALFLRRYQKLQTPFITKSNLAKQYLEQKGLKNVHAIGVGIDREALVTEHDKLDFLNEVTRINGKRILYIGRIEPRRNPHFLVDILSEINKKMDVSLILIGSGDKDYVDSFFDYAKQKQVYQKILYRERIEQKYMEQLYSTSSVFVLPTIYDIYGMVLLEAMYFKECVLTTVNGGSNMMIRNGENGFIFEDFAVNEWVDALAHVLTDSNYCAQIASEANKTIVDHFTWDKLAPQFLKIYEKKLESK